MSLALLFIASLNFISIESSTSPPRITLAPQDVTGVEGGAASFFCKATGSPPPYFTWRKNGKKVRNNRYMALGMNGGSVFRIEPLREGRDEAKYECVADNGSDGVATASADLHILDAENLPTSFPRIVANPELKAVEMGRNANLVCGVEGNPPPKVIWLKDLAPIDPDSDLRFSVSHSGRNHFLMIQKTIKSDEGKYECAATNDVGTVYSDSSTIYVRVRRVPPHFSISPEAVYEVMPGGSLQLPCVAVGSPMPFIKWRAGAYDLTPEDNLPVGRNVLELSDVRESKNYTCVAASELGSIEFVTRVKVKALPQPPTRLSVSDVTPTSVKLAWSVNGEMASHGSRSFIIRYKTKTSPDSDFREISNVKGDHYVVEGLKAYTVYAFNVIAVNNIGRGPPSPPVEAVTGELPPGTAPENVRARPVSSSTVVILWDKPRVPNGQIKGYRVYYSRSPHSALTLWARHEVGTTQITTISDLVTMSTYCIRVLSYNGQGDGPLSDTIFVKTQQGVPLQPRDLSARAETPRSIAIEWTPPEDLGEILTSYELYWNVSSGPEKGQRNHKTIPPFEEYTLAELVPNTLYRIYVTARSARGEGAPSRVVAVKTKPYLPAAPPQDVKVIAVSSTSLRVEWRPPPADSRNGDIVKYRIVYEDVGLGSKASDGDEHSLVRQMDVDGRHTSVQLVNLEKWNPYQVKVEAWTNAGAGPASIPLQVRTEEDVPEEPRRVRLLASSSSTVLVKWKSPRRPNGVIRGYQIHYQPITKQNTPISDWKMFDHLVDGAAASRPSSSHEATLVNLQPKTWYLVQLNGYTMKGDGLRSRALTVETPEAVPTPPRRLGLQLLNDDPIIVQLSWEPPAESFGEVVSYRVSYGVREGRSDDWRTETLEGGMKRTLKANGLEKGRNYEFVVVAANEIGFGESAKKTLLTPEGTPSGSPTNVTSSPASTPTSRRIRWDPPIPELRNGKITQYTVLFHRSDDPLHVNEINVTVAEVELDNLRIDATYVFQVKAHTALGPGPWSPRREFSTSTQRPPAPRDIRLTRQAPDVILVTWADMSWPGIRGFRVYYSNRPNPDDMAGWERLEVGDGTAAEILDLEPRTSYGVRLQAITADQNFGHVSETYVVQPIPFETPDSLRQLRVEAASSSSLRLVWNHPETPGAELYRIRLSSSKTFLDNFSRVQTDSQPYKVIEDVAPKTTSYVVESLVPDTTYKIRVTAVKASVESAAVEAFVKTPIGAPPPIEPPVFFDAGDGKSTVLIELRQASGKHGAITRYLIVVSPDSASLPAPAYVDHSALSLRRAERSVAAPYVAASFPGDGLPETLELGDGRNYGGFFNAPLDSDVRYRVFLRAFTDAALFTSSPYSDPIDVHQILVRSHTMLEAPAKKTNLLVIILPVLAVVFIVLIAGIIFLYRRIKALPDHSKWKRSPLRKKPEKLGNKMRTSIELEPTPLFTGITNNVGTLTRANRLSHVGSATDPVEIRRLTFQTAAMISHPPIHVDHFADHVEMLKAQENQKFSEEYESIEPGQQFTWENSNANVNKPKNRYANVIAYDHSRIVLPTDAASPLGADYINANFMDGYRKQNAYIATQGPLPETFGDFWKMIWVHKTATIVMMTKLEERSRVKCDQYWPSIRGGTEFYDGIGVTLVDELPLAHYTIRTFYVFAQDQVGHERREIRQFQFTAWPDHGVPEHPTPFLAFLRRIAACNPPDAGAIVTHCSAGVGRTGCYIVIDSMLERLQQDNTVDVYGHVTCLRAQRNYMVQTEDQYVFIHDALVEAIASGVTEVAASNLLAHIQKLSQPEAGDVVTGMELEFKRLAAVKALPAQFYSANLPVNKFKNRLVNILPFESNRVPLLSIRGVEGSDYINSSFIDGYRTKNAYIATQGPLQETTEDFWRMLWEHDSTLVVMLTKLREMGREKCHEYWPVERSQRYLYFVVDPLNEYTMPHYIVREFKVTDARDGQSRTIRQFQFTEWPEQGVPKSGEAFIDFIGQVHKTKEQFSQEGPITVHCSAGVGRTGVFVSLSIVLERMRFEGVVDLFQTVKLLRTQRPALVQTEDQYQFCYRSSLEYLGSFDHYAQ